MYIDDLFKHIKSWVHLAVEKTCTEEEAMQKIAHLIQVFYCEIKMK
jgi:hypothetical protein